ncbi:leucine-rich repeat domain-containing protein [Allorhizocola rhizosphaerae]|uniref:leucine-rich repeat domain-containing protein n=1 Tax=Allorhizocola rhizosphaerae TaxID=1872709 RepID=UPI0013C2ABDC|nr:tetratricopeptide repeat protein [Allorhizocola rhizosphaerae]
MTAITEPSSGYRIIDAEQAEERFAVSGDVEYPYQEFAEGQEIRLYEGGLHVAGDFAAESAGDWVRYNVIVDGDLTVDGDLDWWDWSSGNFVLVTGTLRARNVFLRGCPTLVVRGDLLVDNGVQGHHGDDGGFLEVRGATRAKIIVSTLYFNLTFAQQPDAVVVGDPYRTNCPVDFTDEELDEVILPELLGRDGRADEDKVEDALREGRPILRPTATPAHLATLSKLDALLESAVEVTELDLADCRLREFPEQLFAFPHLRKLSLSRNTELAGIPERVAEMVALEELDLSGISLKELTPAVGQLKNLRVLDISGNRFQALPDELGDLPVLEVLRAGDLECPVPDALSRLSTLVDLDLYRLHCPGGFPMVVTRLPRLRKLDLTLAVLGEVPDELLALTQLEELHLDAALGHVERLPDLAKLPRLRVLRMDGRSGNAGRYPSNSLLDGVWSIATLEELGIDRWGEEDGRPALTALPDEAFAAMSDLRRLDLSFNELTTLPESFYSLAGLEFADLRYTKLDSSTLDRLQEVFPEVRIDLRNVDTRTGEVDHPTWQAVHELVKRGSSADPEEAIARFEEAIALCRPGARFSDYDQLYAHYGLVVALEQTDMTEKLMRYAEEALALVPPPGMVWHYTDEGAFQQEVTRRAGNALAWHLMKSGELDKALSTVERALAFASEPDYDYIRDTKVRILLAMGRDDEAYRIVEQVLARTPDFEDFADLKERLGVLDE